MEVTIERGIVNDPVLQAVRVALVDGGQYTNVQQYVAEAWERKDYLWALRWSLMIAIGLTGRDGSPGLDVLRCICEVADKVVRYKKVRASLHQRGGIEFVKYIATILAAEENGLVK